MLFAGDPTGITGDDDAGHVSQIKLWRRMLGDSRGPWRRLVIPDEPMVDRLAELDTICPSFVDVTGWVARVARLAMATSTPLSLNRCVVVGPPGAGKTFYMRRLAEALSVPSQLIAMNMVSDPGSAFSGLAPVWRAASPGKPAKLLLDQDLASPLIIIDEIEKTPRLSAREAPENTLHSLLERENAAGFVDEFVDIPLRAPSLVDRLIAFHVEPTADDILVIQKSMFRRANLRLGQRFAEPTQALFQTMARHNPRLLSRLWDIALAFACADDRCVVLAEDVSAAEHILLSGKAKRREPIGFLPGSAS